MKLYYLHHDNDTTHVEVYVSSEGHIVRREYGTVIPDVRMLHGEWVLRGPDGSLIDYGQYREDLFSKHGFEVVRT